MQYYTLAILIGILTVSCAKLDSVLRQQGSQAQEKSSVVVMEKFKKDLSQANPFKINPDEQLIIQNEVQLSQEEQQELSYWLNQ